MVRVVLYLLLAVIAISVVRSILGALGKAVSGFLEAGTPRQSPAGEPRIAGELKRDPVCGTYVSTATSVKRTIGGKTVHFCSTGCSEKYRSEKD